MTRKHVRSMLCFALVFVLLFLAADSLCHREEEYSATWLRIRKGDVPQVLILGNSHAFCSFVPEMIRDALGLDAAVLATSGLNSVGTTDSFEAALSKGAPEMIIVETNAYSFDYDSTALYHKGTALSNINGMPGLRNRIRSAYREFGYENIPQGAYQLLRADLMWKRWRGGEPVTAEDGSGLLHWHATGSFDAADAQRTNEAMWQESLQTGLSAKEKWQFDERNLDEFHRLMNLAQKHGVKVVLAKAPTTAAGQYGCDWLNHLQLIAQEYDVFLGLRDFHLDVAAMDLRAEDFYDSSHLSRSGAARFTRVFCEWLGGLIGVQPAWQKALYAGERIESAADGLWRYGVDSTCEDAQYRFVLDGEVIQDWSESNVAQAALDPAEASRMSVTIRRGDDENTIAFMSLNTCVLH